MSKVFHLPKDGISYDNYYLSEKSGIYLPRQPIVPPAEAMNAAPSKTDAANDEPPKNEASTAPSFWGSLFCPSVKIPFEKLDPEAKTPTRGTEGSYGSDLYACLGYEPVLGTPGSTIIKKGWVKEIEIGIKVAPPWGCGFMFIARSSQEIKDQLRLLGGAIDWDFGGKLTVFLMNQGNSDVTIHHHDRVAQVIIFPVFIGDWVEYEPGSLPTYPSRGDRGIGSTGR